MSMLLKDFCCHTVEADMVEFAAASGQKLWAAAFVQGLTFSGLHMPLW